jgi:lipopolysaccharide export system permease protein
MEGLALPVDLDTYTPAPITRRIRSFSGSSFTVYRYVGEEFLVSFLVAFAFFFFMFFINQLLLLAEDILQKDVPLWDVLRLIIYSLPSIIALSVPFGTLVGALMAVGRLSADNEVVAFRAAGFPLRRIFSQVLLLALVLSAVSFVTNDFLLPLGTLNFGTLYRELLYANPALELEAYSVKRYQDDVLITGAVEPGRLDNFAIIDTDGQGNRRVITATEARLLRGGDPNAIGLQLDGVTTHSSVSGGEYNYSTADTMRYNILLEDITIAIRSPGPREMSARDVRAAIAEKEAAIEPRMLEWRDRRDAVLARIEALDEGEPGAAPPATTTDDEETPSPAETGGEERAAALETARDELSRIERQRPFDRSLQVYRLEYHKKFSIPFAALSFVILAFPLGLFSRRSGRGVGFGIGLLIATVYWSMLIAGQTFGTQRPEVPPALAMWAPNILFFVVGVVVFLRRARH